MESQVECPEPLVDGGVEQPVEVQLHELGAVLVGHELVLPSRLQLLGRDLAVLLNANLGQTGKKY